MSNDIDGPLYDALAHLVMTGNEDPAYSLHDQPNHDIIHALWCDTDLVWDIGSSKVASDKAKVHCYNHLFRTMPHDASDNMAHILSITPVINRGKTSPVFIDPESLIRRYLITPPIVTHLLEKILWSILRDARVGGLNKELRQVRAIGVTLSFLLDLPVKNIHKGVHQIRDDLGFLAGMADSAADPKTIVRAMMGACHAIF